MQGKGETETWTRENKCSLAWPLTAYKYPAHQPLVPFCFGICVAAINTPNLFSRCLSFQKEGSCAEIMISRFRSLCLTSITSGLFS